MSLNTCPPSCTLTTLGRWQLAARATLAGREFLSVFVILLLNLSMIASGAIEDAIELKSLLTEGAVYESSLVNVFSFLAYPVISCQLLIGLCWLLFHYIPSRRAGIILRKTTFSFVQTLKSQITSHAHGCRAPPRFNG